MNEAEETPAEAAVYTPGPWEWRSFGGPLMLMSVQRGKLVVLQATRKGMQSAEFLMRDAQIVMRPMTRDHPDARLIAAAPELLAIAEELLDYQNGHKGGLSATCRKAERVLAHVRGELPDQGNEK